MSYPLADLLVAQGARLQALEVSPERAEDLAPIVASLVASVSERIGALPFDSDATQFYALLVQARDEWPGQ